MTILGGDYPLVEVRSLDLVGYKGDGTFVILNPKNDPRRQLPKIEKGSLLENIPYCVRAKIENNQIINFAGRVATLHDIAGKWHFKLQEPNSTIVPLTEFTFFEIGDTQ